MNTRLLLLAASLLFVAHPALAKKDAPSRAAVKGCVWEKLSDASLALDAWVQRCDFGFRKIVLFVQQNAIMSHYSDGGDPYPVIEVIDLKDDETPETGIRRIFAEHTPDKTLVARCMLTPYRGKAPKGVKRFTFVPNAALQKELDAKASPDEVPDPPCGDWGDAPDGIQYFEAQPATAARKVLFVRVGQDEPLFDEKTLRLLPPR